jgi:photosystem II stability/assembly factor-like uncharacterized protein
MKTTKLLLSLCLLCAFRTASTAQISMWEPMNNGFMNLLVYTIEIDPVDPLIMYCGTDYGCIYKSSDGGYHWHPARNGIPSNYDQEKVTALYLDKQDRMTLYAGFGGRQTNKNLFVSKDSGSTWNVIQTPDNWKNAGILFIYDIKSPMHRFFCGLGWDTGIYYTDDFITWKQTLASEGVQAIGGHPANPAYVYVGTSAKQHMWRSVDYGLTWKASNNGTNQSSGVRAISLSPGNASKIFIGVTNPDPGLYKSSSDGDVWTKKNTIDQISEIAIHPKNENIMYISAIGTGVMRTTDGGVTWLKMNTGLPTTDVMRVRIAPGFPVRVFAVTLNHGIYRLVDEEIPESMVTFTGGATHEEK